jgi:hypothetical protein
MREPDPLYGLGGGCLFLIIFCIIFWILLVAGIVMAY